eukprot:scaffold630312_cov22-Prasinocladus_malaysianus.AAC.1
MSQGLLAFATRYWAWPCDQPCQKNKPSQEGQLLKESSCLRYNPGGWVINARSLQADTRQAR